MTFEFERTDWVTNWDSFGTEADSFERDVHMLILTSLGAGLKLLKADTQTEDDKLMQYLPTAKGDGAQRLAEDQADLWIQLSHQETFLRNLTLVALMSRLTHSLLSMLRRAELFAPRNTKSYPGEDEFKKMWAEFRDRFDLNFSAKYIGWIEPYRRARNRIVHNGGEANVLKPFAEMDSSAGDEGMYDLSFSKRYPAFVSGQGFSAEVVVTAKLLGHAVESAIRLVKHAAVELRAKELQDAVKSKAAATTAQNEAGAEHA